MEKKAFVIKDFPEDAITKTKAMNPTTIKNKYVNILSTIETHVFI